MVVGCVFFEVRTEFLNIIYMSFSFEVLNSSSDSKFVLEKLRNVYMRKNLCKTKRKTLEVKKNV
jgi:hypothetical protein